MTTVAETYHVPVLLQESVDGLNIRPDGIYVDVTFGGGGHSREILSRLGKKGHLYSFDQDADAEKNAEVSGFKFQDSESTFQAQDNFTFVRSNFRYLKNWMRYYEVDHIDGLLADLGVSSHHFDDETRGFSFRYDAPLDMRMNNRAGRTAADILREYSEEQLADVLYLYGELKQARRMAKTIVTARNNRNITTTGNLLDVLGIETERDDDSQLSILNPQMKKDLARIFQALRIEVNQEMSALTEMLNGARELLATGGRLSVITYHSLEDRLVKNMIRTGNTEGRQQQDFFGRSQAPFRAVNNKVIEANAEEQERNPRSRSAKLRIGEKL